jgi:shikimate 5-dehydrogenase
MKYPGRLVLIGNPVGHSLSPTFQNAALRASGIPLEYEALDVSKSGLHALLQSLKKVSAAGNVTIPHKFSICERCDELTELAARVGAVNTFWFKSGRLHGDNTDVGGFDVAARGLLGGDPSGARIVLLGAGGAAAAVLAAAEAWAGATVSIVEGTGATMVVKKSVTSDGKGEFAIADLPPGEYKLHAEGKAKNNLRKSPITTVPMPTPRVVSDVTIKLQ